MSKKCDKIERLIESLRGGAMDAHYLGYFECFNRELFFEAHDVLEAIWLPQRSGPNGPFYKGLIQLAGAFVHMQKGRLQPASALLRLARANLCLFSPVHDGLDVEGVLRLVEQCLEDTVWGRNPLHLGPAPKLVPGPAREAT